MIQIEAIAELEPLARAEVIKALQLLSRSGVYSRSHEIAALRVCQGFQFGDPQELTKSIVETQLAGRFLLSMEALGHQLKLEIEE